MARAESAPDNRGFVEKTSTSIRNVGLLVALIGAIGIIAALPIGATVFVDGAVAAGAGELGRSAAASGKPKAV